MKIGIVGNGMIVNGFLQDGAFAAHAEFCALCVRPHSLDKGQQLAQTYHIPVVETDYELFLKNPEIETVYVGISNLVHYEYAKKALEAGKHVILEKPFTVKSTEAKALAVLARERHLFLWEAFVIPYLPAYSAVKNAVGRVGTVKLIQCDYSKISSRYSRYLAGEVLPAFDPKLAGGALYDLNIYNLHFVMSLFGKPQNARYSPVKGYNGIDTSGIAVLEYPSFHAVCCAAKDSNGPCFFCIQGEDGTLMGEGSVSTLRRLRLIAPSGEETVLADFDEQHRLTHELNEFIRQFEASDYDTCYKMLEHSVAVTEVVDQLLLTAEH